MGMSSALLLLLYCYIFGTIVATMPKNGISRVFFGVHHPSWQATQKVHIHLSHTPKQSFRRHLRPKLWHHQWTWKSERNSFRRDEVFDIHVIGSWSSARNSHRWCLSSKRLALCQRRPVFGRERPISETWPFSQCGTKLQLTHTRP